MKTVLKLLTALAAIAGTVYVIATYGDKIVTWAKKLLNTCPCVEDTPVEEVEVTEEAPVEEAAPAEEAAEEAPAEEPEAEVTVEIVVDGTEPVAEESDFEG